MGKDGKDVQKGRKCLTQVIHTMMTRQQVTEQELLMERHKLASTLSMVKMSESIILEGEAKAIEKKLYRMEVADNSEIKVVKPLKKSWSAVSLQYPCKVLAMCSQCLTICCNLFFQHKEVEEYDVDWIPRPDDDDEDDDDYYEEDKEGEAEEELLALEDNDDVDEWAKTKAMDQVGGNILSVQQHIVEMDQAGDQ